MRIKADLHIDSTLSPCGSLEMSPAAIVQRAAELGLDVIAVTDHNSVENSFYAAEATRKLPLRVLFGMEAQTREDVHILCLFAERSESESFYGEIYPLLPNVANNPDYFGDQVVVDAQDNIVRSEEKLLMNGLDLSLTELVERVRQHNGRVIPSHVESLTFGLLPVLGVLPLELADALLEVSHGCCFEEAVRIFPELARRRLIGNSDAHYLADIGRVWTEYEVAAASLDQLYQAGQQGHYKVVRR
jgi:hypothetical protein